MKQKNSGFTLPWILITVVITSIISALTTGVIIYNNNKITAKVSYTDLVKDEKLNQFLEVYANITTDYYKDVNKEELLNKAIAAMMNYLGDDYTSYLDNENSSDLESKLSGEYDGIGVSINNEDKSITEVFDNTPASKAKIQVGDIIIGVNGMDVSELSTTEIVNLIKKNTNEFDLKLKRNEEIINVTLKLEKVISPNIKYNVIDNTNIGYMYIDVFSNTLDVQMAQALSNLEKSNIQSLIIDLRDNTGGYLDAAEKVSSMFIEKGKTIYSLNEKNDTIKCIDKTDEHRNYSIAILINENTASAAEIMAAALKESYGAIIIGETSFGKGKVQQKMNLNDGGMVKYTTAYWLTPKGTCIDKVGINPDYFINNEEIKDENGTVIDIADRQLEKAKELLSSN